MFLTIFDLHSLIFFVSIQKHYVYSVSNFRPLGLCQEICCELHLHCLSQPVNLNNVMILSWATWRHFQVAENSKQSKHSVLIWINSLWNFYWDNQFLFSIAAYPVWTHDCLFIISRCLLCKTIPHPTAFDYHSFTKNPLFKQFRPYLWADL